MSDPVEDVPVIFAERYLPNALKADCIVIPKRLFTWTAANIMILGTGLGILIGGVLAQWIDSDLITYGFPASLVIAWLSARLILKKEEKRFLQRIPQKDSDS